MDFKNLSKLNNLSNLVSFSNLSKLFGGTDKDSTSVTHVNEEPLALPAIPSETDESKPQIVLTPNLHLSKLAELSELVDIGKGTTTKPIINSPVVPVPVTEPAPTEQYPLVPSSPSELTPSVQPPILPTVTTVPKAPKAPKTPTPTVQSPVVSSEPNKVILVFMGLPGCGKTAISKEILTRLKTSNGLKTRFIEGRISESSGDEIYLTEISKAINANYDVIITNGQNYIKAIRMEIVKLSQLFKYKILYVDFVHSKDSPNTFEKFKDYCVKVTSNRTDSYKQSFQLSDIIRRYEPFNDSTDPKSYIKLNIDDKFYVNSKKIIDAINKL